MFCQNSCSVIVLTTASNAWTIATFLTYVCLYTCSHHCLTTVGVDMPIHAIRSIDVSANVCTCHQHLATCMCVSTDSVDLCTHNVSARNV